MAKDQTLIPIIKTLIEQGISAQASARLVDSGYSMRRIRALFKEMPAADLSKEEIAEYRIRYAKEQAEIAAKHSARTVASEYGLSRHQVSRIKGAHYPPGLSQSDREEIRGRLLKGIWAKKFASAHSIRKIESELGLPHIRTMEISKRVKKEMEMPHVRAMGESRHVTREPEVPVLASDEPDSVRAFLTMQLSRNPLQFATYY